MKGLLNRGGSTRFVGLRGGALLSTLFLSVAMADGGEPAQPDPTPPESTRDVIFAGNNWEGMIDVIDAETYQRIGRINGVPDKKKRMLEISINPVHLIFFQAIRQLIGEGNDQYVDDMYSTLDGRLLIVSRPSFADVVGIDIASGDIAWRFEVEGYRSDHMALSPDGTQVAVSASTGKVVHVLDVETGQELGRFDSGNSPHENVYSEDGSKLYHASIGHVFLPLDRGSLEDLKGDRRFMVVDTSTWEPIESFDFSEKLEAADLGHLSPAIRPMAHTADEKTFYFQLSFLHGFVEYDMQEGVITRKADLPNLVPDLPVEQYINDSAHHGMAMSGDDSTLCVAGTMSDYVALVDRQTFDYELLTDLGKKPYWVTTDESGEYCYISWSGTDQMSVISYSERKEVARINVGDHPQRIREGRVPSDWSTPF
ncbi:serine/threonine protein kinase [gamma proteobacterium HTCC5015]|nr:serine/threonine protein kinase [gamma proteobacterium HTCC5015]